MSEYLSNCYHHPQSLLGIEFQKLQNYSLHERKTEDGDYLFFSFKLVKKEKKRKRSNNNDNNKK